MRLASVSFGHTFLRLRYFGLWKLKRSEFAMLLHRAVERLRIVGITICVSVSTLLSGAQMVLSQPGAARDLQSIIDAKLLRVAVSEW